MSSPVGIFRLTREWSTYGWLCARHFAARVADRWICERVGDVDGDCQDCELERQRVAAYCTPTLVPLLLAPDRKHIPAKGAPETIGRPRKARKPTAKEIDHV